MYFNLIIKNAEFNFFFTKYNKFNKKKILNNNY